MMKLTFSAEYTITCTSCPINTMCQLPDVMKSEADDDISQVSVDCQCLRYELCRVSTKGRPAHCTTCPNMGHDACNIWRLATGMVMADPTPAACEIRRHAATPVIPLMDEALSRAICDMSDVISDAILVEMPQLRFDEGTLQTGIRHALYESTVNGWIVFTDKSFEMHTPPATTRGADPFADDHFAEEIPVPYQRGKER